MRRSSGYALAPEHSVLSETVNGPIIQRFKVPEPVREVSRVVHHRFARTQLLSQSRQLVLTQVLARLPTGQASQKIDWC